jgi:hypothetical protein
MILIYYTLLYSHITVSYIYFMNHSNKTLYFLIYNVIIQFKKVLSHQKQIIIIYIYIFVIKQSFFFLLLRFLITHICVYKNIRKRTFRIRNVIVFEGKKYKDKFNIKLII